MFEETMAKVNAACMTRINIYQDFSAGVLFVSK
jgi:hypothetical protein